MDRSTGLKVKDVNKDVAHKLARDILTMSNNEAELAIRAVLDVKDDVYTVMTFEDKVFEACKNESEHITSAFSHLLDLKNIKNYIEFSMETPEGTQFIFTARRHDGKTPGKVATELTAEVVRLEEELRKLKENLGVDGLPVFAKRDP